MVICYQSFNPMVTVIRPELLNSCIIPHVYNKSKDFETYLFNTLFPKEKFVLISRPGNRRHLIFTFRDLVTGFEFSAECIFRMGLIANSFQCSTNIKCNKKSDHFLILGLGGAANMPNQVFLINSGTMGLNILSKRHLRDKNINPQSAVSSSQLRKKNMLPDYADKKVA